VRAQTGVEMGFLQQLCTLSDHAAGTPGAPPVIAVSYLVARASADRTRSERRSCYAFLPWEDWRHGRPGALPTSAPA
jgi:hypothetical protein